MSTWGDRRLSVIVRRALATGLPAVSLTVMSSVPPRAPPATLVLIETGASAALSVALTMTVALR